MYLGGGGGVGLLVWRVGVGGGGGGGVGVLGGGCGFCCCLDGRGGICGGEEVYFSEVEGKGLDGNGGNRRGSRRERGCCLQDDCRGPSLRGKIGLCPRFYQFYIDPHSR